ncbi:MAG: glycerol-3-phosphate dehydrogenase/oxidase [Acidobacteria bacterium]|nr:glycerol-3-phosphate dehydrogenase/oxidase [Acidobacteriota bacterium]MBI3656108.1 glycerol-3-phosphate dehydrogenase/oxidase [Acidobacteriota bacterium]
MRAQVLDQLANRTFDLLVIGGGITGMGIAQDAAARGMQVALADKSDFAGGTSSKSSKLIHGGLRYLQQLDIAVTRESCRERNLLRQLAPGLVEPLQFLMPLFRYQFKSLLFSAGLIAYDRLAGVAKPAERHRRVGRAEVLRLAPCMNADKVTAGLLYYDAITDDARLTLTVARSAERHGAVLSNYVQVIHLLKFGSQVCGAMVHDLIHDRKFEIKARAVVNAGGVWIDAVRHMDRKDSPALVYPAMGIHITIPQEKLPVETAIVIPSAHDRRLLFVIPWLGVTVIGTTDTPYQGPLDQPQAAAQDVDYVIDAVNDAFSVGLARKDLISTYAGLRPLIGKNSRSTADVSRRHRVFESESGLLTIAGGKLTTYRSMAADIVDRVARRLSVRVPCRTQAIVLVDPWNNTGDALAAPAPDIGAHLRQVYGAEAAIILDWVEENPGLCERLISALPYIKAEVVYAVRRESAMTLEDVLARRTRILLQDRSQGMVCAPTVADLMATELGWGEARRDQQLRDYADYARRHRPPE